MITWIKFSERQPDKKGEYLCWYGGLIRILNWDYRSGTFIFYSLPVGAHGRICDAPDYWAEINPPGVTRRSGITVTQYDPKAFNLLRDLLLKEVTVPIDENLPKWGNPDVAHRLFKVYCQLDESTNWSEMPDSIKQLHVKALKAINTLLAAAIKADGSAATSPTKEPPMPEKPLCKDCRWCFEVRAYFLCQEEAHAEISPVNGERISQFCNNVRRDADLCGPDGRWFEAKTGDDFGKFTHKVILDHLLVLIRVFSSDDYGIPLTVGERTTFIELVKKIQSGLDLS